MRGAKDENSVWFGLCRELGENCEIILPLLKSVEQEVREGGAAGETRHAVEDTIAALGHAVGEGVRLVGQCRGASKAALFFRGEALKSQFKKVAERVARCLRNVPLAAMPSTLQIQRDVARVCSLLETARWPPAASHAQPPPPPLVLLSQVHDGAICRAGNPPS